MNGIKNDLIEKMAFFYGCHLLNSPDVKKTVFVNTTLAPSTKILHQPFGGIPVLTSAAAIAAQWHAPWWWVPKASWRVTGHFGPRTLRT